MLTSPCRVRRRSQGSQSGLGLHASQHRPLRGKNVALNRAHPAGPARIALCHVAFCGLAGTNAGILGEGRVATQLRCVANSSCRVDSCPVAGLGQRMPVSCKSPSCERAPVHCLPSGAGSACRCRPNAASGWSRAALLRVQGPADDHGVIALRAEHAVQGVHPQFALDGGTPAAGSVARRLCTLWSGPCT